MNTVQHNLLLLCDPRDKVIVRRILGSRQCTLWFPENQTVAMYNATLRAESSTASAGYMAETEVPTSGGMMRGLGDDNFSKSIRASAAFSR